MTVTVDSKLRKEIDEMTPEQRDEFFKAMLPVLCELGLAIENAVESMSSFATRLSELLTKLNDCSAPTVTEEEK